LLPIVPVVTLKVADVLVAATVTDEGTVSAALVFDKLTLAPPVGAACVKVTVQVLEEFCPRLPGLHDNVETVADATRLTLVLAELLL